MSYIFLTACRNEELLLEEFLEEFRTTLEEAGISEESVLYVVDDLSTDRSVEILERHRNRMGAVRLEIIRAPTNLGNQGALFYGLEKIEIGKADTLVTFDCDGEDDVGQIPSILELGKVNPHKVVLIERGERKESLIFRIAFHSYKILFRFLTRQAVIPNNFLLIPGEFVPYVRRTPLAAVHFGYGILRMKFPSVSTRRDRRTRYGGKSSQNLFMIASHGLVGLMIFYETVIAKLLFLLVLLGASSLGAIGCALVVPAQFARVQRGLIWAAGAIGGLGLGFFSLLLSAALALIFKMAVFTLSREAAETRPESTSRRAAISSGQGDGRSGRSEREVG